ncbi:MAG: glutaminyl-peptide cyclotransferase [Christensenellales bacterium]
MRPGHRGHFLRGALAALFLILAPGARAAEVISSIPLDPGLFTQGLEVVDGRLLLSSGLYGRSMIGEVDPASGRLRGVETLDGAYFAEGLAACGQGIWQLTWREGIAILRDRTSLREIRRETYSGQGWGLCFDGKALYMSDGSGTLTLRDPETFRALGKLAVTFQGLPLLRLNELEYAEGFLYANIWMQDIIVRIDPADGRVVLRYDLSALKSLAFRTEAPPDSDAVLNGIAHLGEDRFYVTGKRWPRLFLVRLPAEGDLEPPL